LILFLFILIEAIENILSFGRFSGANTISLCVFVRYSVRFLKLPQTEKLSKNKKNRSKTAVFLWSE